MNVFLACIHKGFSLQQKHFSHPFPMRILHTADWHLGKKLDQNDRSQEHQMFLDWLLDTIQALQIEALLIAGDVFDSGSPANETLRMYYNFLVRLRQTCCRHAVIIGGNHDSISTLNAPKELLRALQVHVVGGVPDQPAEQIIPLTNAAGETEAIVVAVPFLRDRDVRLSIPGESALEREQRIREGIAAHYHKLLPLVADYLNQNIPVIATGHLFAQGAAPSDSEKEIHVGSLGQVPASAFPNEFAYIALGHLHRPQSVGGIPQIRYSGSPIPLSFSEAQDEKQVVILHALPQQGLNFETITVPVFRKLLRLAGNPEKVKQLALPLQILPTAGELPAWIEVQVHTQNLLTRLQDELQEIFNNKPGFGQLFVRQLRLREATGIGETDTGYHHLVDMSPQHVFALRIQSLGEDPETEALESTFSEALQLLEEREGAL